MQFIESNRDELAHLRCEVEKLTSALRTYEAGELQAEQDRDNMESALKGKHLQLIYKISLLDYNLSLVNQFSISYANLLFEEVEILKTQLRVRDEELLKAKSAFENEIRDARRAEGMVLNNRKKSGIPQDVLDSALAVSRKRITELQKSHNHLLGRYIELQEAYVDLKEGLDQEDSQPQILPLLSGGRQRSMLDNNEGFGSSQSSSPIDRRKRGMSDPDFGAPSVNTGSVKLGRLETSYSSQGDARSPSGGVRGGMGNAVSGAAEYHFGPQGANFTGSGSMGSDEYPLDGSGKPKVKPQSDTRVFGRGGVQNIGKIAKDTKKDKGKGKEGEPLSPTGDSSVSTKKKKGVLGFGL